MRLYVSKRNLYHADIYCPSARQAKQMLVNQHVSIVAIDYYLDGRETGCDLLTWAIKKNHLPNYVVVMESDRTKRSALVSALKSGGYLSADETTFIKH